MNISCGFCKLCSYTYLVTWHKDVVHQIWRGFPSDCRVGTKGTGISSCTRWAVFVNMALYFVYDGFLYGENATHCISNSLINGISTHFQFKCWFKKWLILKFLLFISSFWSDVSIIQKMKIVYLKFLLDLKCERFRECCCHSRVFLSEVHDSSHTLLFNLLIK